MMKRFRNQDGRLTMSLPELKKATAEEASKYYRIGGIYQYTGDSTKYTYVNKDNHLAYFQSIDGKNLFIPVDSLGTFLPDVASVGSELMRTE